MEIINKYFPELNSVQINKLALFKDIFNEWNQKVNMISRKDIDNFYLKHVLNSLAIAKIIELPHKTTIADIGTGGGFPGVPLAIFFLNSQFTLIDSRKNKTIALKDICEKLELSNTLVLKSRSESHKGKYDIVTGRAVTAFPEFHNQTKHLINKKSPHKEKGIYYLKGGDTSTDKSAFPRLKEYKLSDLFCENYYESKKLIHLPF